MAATTPSAPARLILSIFFVSLHREMTLRAGFNCLAVNTITMLSLSELVVAKSPFALWIMALSSISFSVASPSIMSTLRVWARMVSITSSRISIATTCLFVWYNSLTM